MFKKSIIILDRILLTLVVGRLIYWIYNPESLKEFINQITL